LHIKLGVERKRGREAGRTHDGISSVVSITSTMRRCSPELGPEAAGEAEGGGDEAGALLLASRLSVPFVAGDATGLGVDVLVAESAEGSPSNTTGVADVDVDVDPEAVDEPVGVDTLDTAISLDSNGSTGGIPRD
jgi:hypothetical protein